MSKIIRNKMADLVNNIEALMEITQDPELYVTLADLLENAKKVDSNEKARLFFVDVNLARK